MAFIDRNVSYEFAFKQEEKIMQLEKAVELWKRRHRSMCRYSMIVTFLLGVLVVREAVLMLWGWML